MLPVDGEAQRWALLQEKEMPVPVGTSYVGRLGRPGWGEGGGTRDSHWPKEIRVMAQVLQAAFFQTP